MLDTALTRANNSLSRLSNRDPFFGLIDRFMGDDFFGNLVSRGAEAGDNRPWMPAVDIVETDAAFVANVDLPGLSKKDVEVSIEDNVLTLSGERVFKGGEENSKFRRIERAYGSFRRSFALPPGIDAGKVEATFKDGVLSLTMPKSETAKPRKISIS